MSEYAILLTALLTSVAVVGGLILGAIYFTYNAIKSDIAQLRTELVRVESRLDAKTDDIRSELGGKIDANTAKLAELATEVQVHLRTHHLIGEIERISTPTSPQNEEGETTEEANQPS